jgi:hydroxymethylpyrimidine/phosphomethylpyrimidine kinase
MNVKKVLTIAGSDSSGGAGIQADIKTIAAHDMYAMSAITSLTAQNTTGVISIFDATPQFVADELDAVFSDIRPDAVKIGMVSQAAIICTIADKLQAYHAANIVLDPVMIASSGQRLLAEDAIQALCRRLFPLARLITPNIPELACLTHTAVKDQASMCQAARQLSQALYRADGSAPALLIKGGHLAASADDLLYENNISQWFKSTRIANSNTHGTGCTLSSALACELADGHSLPAAVRSAKAYLTGALRAQLDLGQGSGPLWHNWQHRRLSPDVTPAGNN